MNNIASRIFNENKKAYHDYHVLESLEVGIELFGSEVKSVKNKCASLSGAYVQVLKNELWLVNAKITGAETVWTQSCRSDRNRKLLCHKKEMLDIKQKTEAKGLTAIPLKLYEKNGKIKLLVGIARGKNAVDKRQTLKDKSIDRALARYNV